MTRLNTFFSSPAMRHVPRPRTRTAVCVAAAAVLVAATATLLGAHDLFLKPDAFFVAPNSDLNVRVLNGTFTASEAGVKRERLRDLSIVSPTGLARADTTAWEVGEKMSTWHVRVGESGTYVLGASLLPRELRLEAKDFNKYLATDGVPDVLAERRRSGELDRPARERYQKHVKAVLQVGARRSGGFDRALGYPAELVPLDNPYSLRRGAALRVRALVDGKPVANQYVISGGRTPSGSRIAQHGVRTDADGVAHIGLRSAGVWYIKFIHMARAAGDTAIDYESKWATLTFAVR